MTIIIKTNPQIPKQLKEYENYISSQSDKIAHKNLIKTGTEKALSGNISFRDI